MCMIQQPNTMSKTAHQVRSECWSPKVSPCRNTGFPVRSVRAVIYGHNKGLRGQSHRIAVALGMKAFAPNDDAFVMSLRARHLDRAQHARPFLKGRSSTFYCSRLFRTWRQRWSHSAFEPLHFFCNSFSIAARLCENASILTPSLSKKVADLPDRQPQFPQIVRIRRMIK